MSNDVTAGRPSYGVSLLLRRHSDTVTSGREVGEPAHANAAWPSPGLDLKLDGLISLITNFELYCTSSQSVM